MLWAKERSCALHSLACWSRRENQTKNSCARLASWLRPSENRECNHFVVLLNAETPFVGAPSAECERTQIQQCAMHARTLHNAMAKYGQPASGRITISQHIIILLWIASTEWRASTTRKRRRSKWITKMCVPFLLYLMRARTHCILRSQFDQANKLCVGKRCPARETLPAIDIVILHC